MRGKRVHSVSFITVGACTNRYVLNDGDFEICLPKLKICVLKMVYFSGPNKPKSCMT